MQISRYFVFTAAALVIGDSMLSWAQNPPKDKSIPGFTPGPVMNKVRPGRFIIDPPTLENLGLRWYIEGDSNRNASVAVSYRIKGQTAWNKSLPMLRVHHELANQDYGPYRTGNLFAGSVLFLQPDTQYEVRLVMRDPDGGAPPPKHVTVATRTEPGTFADGRKLHIYPRNYAGPLSKDSLVGLQNAVEKSQPGDILLLHTGCYQGPFTFTHSGTPVKPIVLRGGIDGDTILQGPDHKTDLLTLEKANYLHFEDLTLRRAKTAIRAGSKKGPGAIGLVVRRCKIEDVITGLLTYSENSTNWYIADNIITGVNPTWYPRPSKTYMSPAHTGVNIYGRGHVVCYNRISRFSDSLAIANYGVPVKDIEKHCVAIDFYNNDLSFAQDDCLETDYGCHNIRVYRNRGYNAHTGLSVQPSYGGPIYLIRNELYGITALTFKLHNYCTGLEVYHNTVCCARSGFQSFNRWQNGHFYNNLILGGRDFTESSGRTRKAYALETGTITAYSSLDYNGYRRNGPGELIHWYDGRTRARFVSLADFTQATGHEKHGIMVDYDIFQNAAPSDFGVTCEPRQYDLRLKSAAIPVDKGCPLPNVNDRYTGQAPDLGCYERNLPLPQYGPRNKD